MGAEQKDREEPLGAFMELERLLLKSQEDVAVSLEKARQALLSALAEPARAAGGSQLLATRTTFQPSTSGDMDLPPSLDEKDTPCGLAFLDSQSANSANHASFEYPFLSVAALTPVTPAAVLGHTSTGNSLPAAPAASAVNHVASGESRGAAVASAAAAAGASAGTRRSVHSKESAGLPLDALHMASSDVQLSSNMGKLDTCMGVVVLLNALLMIFDLECEGQLAAQHVGLIPGMDCHGSDVFVVGEHVFTILFLVELTWRVYLDRCRYFCDPLNIFDGFLAFYSAFYLYLLVPLLGSQASLSLLKLLRVAKLVRTVRIMRTLRLFRGLRLLVHACFSFLPSLGWAMAMLGLCMICSGLAMGNLMQEYIVDETQDADSRLWIWMHYGTSYRAIYTMYEMTFAGNWPNYARPVLENVSQLYCIFYLLYITVIVFAVIRVISAIFVKETLEVASNDAEVIVQERIRQKAMYVSKLEAIFMAMDDSGDGLLSEAEMNEWLMNERVQAYLSSLDLDVAEGEALFRLLQNDDGEITYQDFIAGIMRCKGPARAIDQICLQTEVHHLSDALLQLLVALEDAAIIPHSDRRGKAFLTRSKHQMALLQATKNLGSEGSFGPMRSLRC
ncbi:unnamed protein product [Effrenium voratum]|uniref:EF-hand domain-containing protein n=1 Tax=Effrenium voratum TaxID=2562239 RepID=A0AA36JRB4_9DINO|nr:unnamed protein product [Effrenium voratum]